MRDGGEMTAHEKWIQETIELAIKNVHAGTGGPFGAIVVKDGQIVGRGRNQVTSLNDPTAHAEVQAIRDACRNLNTYQLTDCIIYSSCEPCPMCIGAIYWSRPKAVYFAATKHDAADAGFDDHFIYEQIALPLEERSIKMQQLMTDDHTKPFEVWKQIPNKLEY